MPSLEADQLPPGPGGIVTFSPRFTDVLARARAVAPTQVPVLLFGESGTGKEVARARDPRPLRRGAARSSRSTAARSRRTSSRASCSVTRRARSPARMRDQPGLVRAADGGTLFLDEIGDLPLALAGGAPARAPGAEVMPVGGTPARGARSPRRRRDPPRPRRDGREGTFRHDLFARLQGVVLELTPLRERPEDVPLLIRAVLTKLAPERPDVKLSPEAAQALLEHPWPLNVRELEQALAGGLALSGVGPIEAEHLPRTIREAGAEPPSPTLTEEETRHREELVVLLQEHRGNLSAVARAAGKGRTRIVRWVSRYAIDPDAFKRR